MRLSCLVVHCFHSLCDESCYCGCRLFAVAFHCLRNFQLKTFTSIVHFVWLKTERNSFLQIANAAELSAKQEHIYRTLLFLLFPPRFISGISSTILNLLFSFWQKKKVIFQSDLFAFKHFSGNTNYSELQELPTIKCQVQNINRKLKTFLLVSSNSS